jgi:hypothetical protein
MALEPMRDSRTFLPAPTPAMAQEQVTADVVSLDSMRSSVLTNMAANFEQDDLDVPAFLRKRSDVM